MGEVKESFAEDSAEFIIEIQPFDGEGALIEFFFGLVSDVTSVNNWEQDKAMAYLRSNLVDDALVFFDHLMTHGKCTSIQEVQSEFVKQFQNYAPQFTVKDLQNICLLPEETIRVLAWRVQNVIYKIFGKTINIHSLGILKYIYFMQALPAHIRDTVISEGIVDFYNATERAKQLHNFCKDSTNENPTDMSSTLNDINIILDTVVQNQNFPTHNFPHTNNTSVLVDDSLDNIAHTDKVESCESKATINSDTICEVVYKDTTLNDVHEKGKDNVNIRSNSDRNNNSGNTFEDFSIDIIRSEQLKDTFIQNILTNLKSKEHARYFLHPILNILCISLRGDKENFRTVIPKALVPQLLTLYHTKHQGITNMFFKLRRKHTWRGMFYSIRKHIISCHKCRKVKAKLTSATPKGTYNMSHEHSSYLKTPDSHGFNSQFWDSGIGNDLHISKILETVKIDTNESHVSPDAKQKVSQPSKIRSRKIFFGTRVYLKDNLGKDKKKHESYIVLKKVSAVSFLVQRENNPNSTAFVTHVDQITLAPYFSPTRSALVSPCRNFSPVIKYTPINSFHESFRSYTEVQKQLNWNVEANMESTYGFETPRQGRPPIQPFDGREPSRNLRKGRRKIVQQFGHKMSTPMPV